MISNNFANFCLGSLPIRLIRDQENNFQTKEKVESFINDKISEYNKDYPEKSFHSLDIPKWDSRIFNGYFAKFFYSQRSNSTIYSDFVTTMGGKIDNELDRTTVHTILFLYKGNQFTPTDLKVKAIWHLFALASNEGAAVVNPLTNYQFPMQIALKVVDPKISSAGKKHLAGTTDSSKETYKQELHLKTHELTSLWEWTKEFTSHFKPASSLYNPRYGLEPFLDDHSQQKYGVEIKQGSIKISGEIPLVSFVKILNHFYLIASGEKTYIRDQNSEIEETIDQGILILSNIQIVAPSEIATLNYNLCKQIHISLKNKRIQENFYFVSPHYQDYYSAGWYKLSIDEREYGNWTYRPSIKQILEILEEYFGTADFKTFKEILNKIKFKYQFQKKPFSFEDFFQGEISVKNQTYFRVDGIWLVVKADHLAVIHRNFHEVLKNSLVDAADSYFLTKPWITSPEQAAISLEDTDENSKKDFESIVLELMETKFSFIESSGKIKTPYPTYCLLKSISDNKLIPTIKKNWDQLVELMSESSINNKTIHKDSLSKILKIEEPDKPSSSTSKPAKSKLDKVVENLFNALMTLYPVIEKNSQEQPKSAKILSERNIAILEDISIFTIPTKIISESVVKKHKIKINNLLQSSKLNCKPLYESDFKFLSTSDSHKRFFQSLKDGLNYKIREDLKLDQQRFVVQGPIPDKYKLNPHYDLLNEAHENYKKIQNEEGYNRQYANEPDHYIGDQTYPDNNDKFEIFDILKVDYQNEEVLLYHVKEGFGQKTREACAQIRVAAMRLDSNVIERFYSSATKSQSAAPFRKRLKDQLLKDFKNPDDFVRIFLKFKKVFIYAFLDSSTSGRILSKHEDPSYEFSEKDFETIGFSPQESSIILNKLKQEGYLDSIGRITDKFILDPKSISLNLSNQSNVAEPDKKIQKLLEEKISSFNSLISKIEILELSRFLKSKGYEFKICQIPNHGSILNTQNNPFPTRISLDHLEIPPVQPAAKSIYEKNKHFFLEYSFDTEEEALSFIINPIQKNISPREKIREFLFKNTANQNVIKFLNGRDVYTVGSQKIKVDEHLWQAVIEIKTIDPSFNIFDANGNIKVSFRIKISEERILSKDNFVYSAYKANEEKPKNKKSVIQFRYAKLQNKNNDCFFNSLAQFIYFTPILRKYLEIDTKAKPSSPIHQFWIDFFDQYQKCSQSNNLCAVNSEEMRTLFQFHPFNREDCDELLAKSIDDKLLAQAGIYIKYSIIETVDPTSSKEIPKGDHGLIGTDNRRSRDLTETFLSILGESLIPEITFQDLIDKSMKSKEYFSDGSNNLKYSQSDKSYESEKYSRITKATEISKSLIVKILRFKKNGSNYSKQNQKIKFSSLEVKLLDKKYLIKGFIVHEGDDLSNGHYVTYYQTNDDWLKFNDESISKIEESEAIDAAENCCILSLAEAETKSKKLSASSQAKIIPFISNSQSSSSNYLGYKGLTNSGTDCFVNVIAQFIHSSPILKEYFKTHVSSDHPTTKIWHDFFDYFDRCSGPVFSHETEKIRNAVNFGPGERDAFELLEFSLTDDLKSKFSITSQKITTVDTSLQTPITPPADLPSALDSNNQRQKIEEEPWLYVDSEKLINGTPFEDLLKYLLKNEEPKNDLKNKLSYSQSGSCFSSQKYTIKTKVLSVNSEIIIQLKRFDRSPTQTKKIESKITFSSTPYKILDRTFELKSFVVHRGSFEGGHYIFYSKTSDGWVEFNDSVTRSITEVEALEKAQDLYFLRLEEVNPPINSPDTQGQLLAQDEEEIKEDDSIMISQEANLLTPSFEPPIIPINLSQSQEEDLIEESPETQVNSIEKTQKPLTTQTSTQNTPIKRKQASLNDFFPTSKKTKK
jgi:ubiquitin C-terminal hydrolase